MGVSAAGAQGSAESGDDIERRTVENGTAFWTLSFYISHPQIIGHDLAMPLEPGAFGPGDRFKDAHALAENVNMARYFVDHRDWAVDGGTRTLDDLREVPQFDARARADAAELPDPVQLRTEALRRAINPLFNDIADRSRLGRIEDQLFAVTQAEDFTFVLPKEVRWSTEGRTFAVPIDDPDEARFAIKVTRFWYLHGNGAMSWHISFEVNYRDEAFAAALANQRVPTGLYLLSLMQKLAYPKESEIRERKAEAGEGTEKDCRSDELFELRLVDPAMEDTPQLFWNVIYHWFEQDKSTIAAVHGSGADVRNLLGLCPHIAINEIPELFCFDTRSNFFLRDEAFFKLIQPKNANGELENRRTRVRDEWFAAYPSLIDAYGVTVPDPLNSKQTVTMLGPDYWSAMLAPGVGSAGDSEPDGPGPADRLFYLFLAGFNQNIIDWTNQDASEVLDSLDPIYPNSDEQQSEGFFIRYANPRCLITYVQRSRTLEVGNDFIGTCPYAFLIHVLAMHNERLTRDQEKLAFAVVEKVNSYLRAAQAGRQRPDGIGRLIREAEEWINWYRIAAFEHFDRHRYFNPFRYDTERDVFTELERLRGTSRLAAALDKALAALDESTRDIQRVREDADADQRLAAAEEDEKRNRFMTLVFGFVGLAGLAQVVLQIDQLMYDPGSQFGWGRVAGDLAMTLGIAALIPVGILSWRNIAYLFRR